VFPRLERFQLAGRSLARLVGEHYHRVPERARQRFSVGRLPGERAALLGVSPRTALLQVDRELDFAGAQAAIVATISCRTDEFAFSQTLET
jgi:GntR family transcriptional regulator